MTLCNRGQTNATLFPTIKQIKGDRNTNQISELIQGDWDYIIDLSAYFPKSLAQIIPTVGNQLKKYIFISTCSVYKLGEAIPLTESATLKICQPEDWEDETDSTYGERKVACETLLQKSKLNFTILRPALVYGKYDPTDRFYYWLHQVKTYEKIGLPNKGKQKFSITYIEDLIQSILYSINPKKDRVAYNIVSFPKISVREIVEMSRQILDKSPKLINLPPTFLHDNKISQWLDMPLWIDGDYFVCDNQKMINQFDFQIVPFDETVRKTIAYYQTLNWPIPKYGIDRARQLSLIEQQVS